MRTTGIHRETGTGSRIGFPRSNKKSSIGFLPSSFLLVTSHLTAWEELPSLRRRAPSLKPHRPPNKRAITAE